MLVFAIAARGTDVTSMPWGTPCDDAGRTVLFATLASSNFDFFGDLLYFVVELIDGGYQHIGLVAVSIAAFVVPAIACALRNSFFSKFVATGRTIAPVLRQKIVQHEYLRNWRTLPRFLLWLLAWLLLLGLVALLLLLWTLVLLATLVLGVNMKLFALPGFLRFSQRLLSPKSSLQPSPEDQVVALNEALFFELTLESVPHLRCDHQRVPHAWPMVPARRRCAWRVGLLCGLPPMEIWRSHLQEGSPRGLASARTRLQPGSKG